MREKSRKNETRKNDGIQQSGGIFVMLWLTAPSIDWNQQM